MIEEICDFIHNWFIRSVEEGTFTVTGGVLQTEIPQGQFYAIHGSTFSDGIHRQGETITYGGEPVTETFTGTVSRLAIPDALVTLAGEIEEYTERYGEAINSPYQSESFGGYSYTRAAAGNRTTASGADWRSVYSSRLNRWRKL